MDVPRERAGSRTRAGKQEGLRDHFSTSIPISPRQLPWLPPTPEAWRPTAAEDEDGVRITKFRQPLPGWNVYFLKMNRTLQILKEGR